MFLENKIVIELSTKIKIREPTGGKVSEEMVKQEVDKVIRPLLESEENKDGEYAKLNIKIKKHKYIKEKEEK